MTGMRERVTVIKCDECKAPDAVTVRVVPSGTDGFTVDLCPEHMAPVRALEVKGQPIVVRRRRSNTRRKVYETAEEPVKKAVPKRKVNLKPTKPQ